MFDKKKLKRTVFIQNRYSVLQYILFQSLGSVKKETLFSKDVLNGYNL